MHATKFRMAAPGRTRRDRTAKRDAQEPRGRPWRVEPPDEPSGGGQQGPRRAFPPWLIWALLLGLLVNWAITSTMLGTPQPTDVSYSYFYAQVEAGNVTEVTSVEDEITGTFEKPVSYPAGAEKPVEVTDFRTQRPAFGDDQLVQTLIDKGVEVNAEPEEAASWWQQVLIGFGPMLLFIALLIWFLRRASAGMSGGGLGNLGRSKAKLYRPESGPRTTFADVAGIDEVQAEVMEVVDFLKNPERYRRLGASIPKGVLLDRGARHRQDAARPCGGR